MTDNKIEKRPATLKNLEDSSVEITASLSAEELNQYRTATLKELNETISLDGFRKGHIPENILIEKVGEMDLLYKMTGKALENIYPTLLKENNLNAIGQPQISILKMAPNNPVEFKITTAILPEFKLPDYKTISGKINKEKIEIIEITDAEVDDAIARIQKMNIPISENADDATTGATKIPQVPELTDEFVKKLGAFKDVEDFKIKLKENLHADKKQKATEAQRVKLMDTILENTTIILPKIILEGETNRIFEQTKADIARMGLQFDKYLEQIKKTEEEFRETLRPGATKRAKIQLVLDKIIKTENIQPDAEEVQKNIDAILAQHKEAKIENIRPYIEMVLANQEVFKLLEKEV